MSRGLTSQFRGLRTACISIVRILKHTVQSPLDDAPTNSAFFDAIKSPAYLRRLSQKGIYFPFWIRQGDSMVMARPNYEFWVEDIRAGDALIADAINKYQRYLDSKTLALVSAVLQDDFYHTDYRFNRRDNEQELIPMLMKQQNVRSSFLGTWYFKGAYYDDATQSVVGGDYSFFLAFIKKAERLISHLNSDEHQPINLLMPAYKNPAPFRFI